MTAGLTRWQRIVLRKFMGGLLLMPLTIWLPTFLFGAVTLSWEPSASSSVTGYHVYRGKSRDKLKRITRSPVQERQFEDVTPIGQGPVLYAVTSVNEYGQESEPSNAVQVFEGRDGIYPLQAGRASLDNQWVTIFLPRQFVNPVVVMKSLSFNGYDPAIIRVRNIGSRSFEARIQEWEYLDGTHKNETADFMVAEAGRWDLPGGLVFEAGKTAVTQRGEFSSTYVGFSTRFRHLPRVFTSVVSDFGADNVVSRNKNVSLTEFDVLLQEQEMHPRYGTRNDQFHNEEYVDWIAFQSGEGTESNQNYEVGGGQRVDHIFQRTRLRLQFEDIPCLIADMQETNGLDPASLRLTDLTPEGFFSRVQDEQSWDEEVSHVGEEIGYFAIECEPLDMVYGTQSTASKSLEVSKASGEERFELTVSGPSLVASNTMVLLSLDGLEVGELNWYQISGPPVDLRHREGNWVSFVAPEVEDEVTVQLIVQDGSGAKGNIEVRILPPNSLVRFPQ